MINHYYTHYANQTFNGIDGDTEENYLLNLKSPNRSKLEENDLINNQVTYTFNSHGFRADEFTSTDQILFLGDSYTFGMGVPYEMTWARLVSKELNLHNHNLAIGGSSHNTAFRLFFNYVDLLKPKIVVFITTETTRFEIIVDGKPVSLGPWWPRSDVITGNFYKQWILDEENTNLNYQKNCLAIQGLCTQKNIKYIQYGIVDCFPWPLTDLGRDLNHPGMKSHKSVSEKILSRLG